MYDILGTIAHITVELYHTGRGSRTTITYILDLFLRASNQDIVPDTTLPNFQDLVRFVE
jgi:hypothetical protein